MIPSLKGIDHIHINVSNRERSEVWYEEFLGFVRETSLAFWAADGGPLTLVDASGQIHLALFESSEIQNTTIAFKVSAEGLIEWINHLDSKDVSVKPIDHELSWSIYFKDIDGNPFEITTYEYQEFKQTNKKNA